MTKFNFIRWAARELSPDCPIKFLTELAHCPRPTAKAWYSGHRRAPIWFLQRLRDQRKTGNCGISLDSSTYHIQQREREPPRARGFMLRDPLTGMDKRNRRGRPRKSGDAEYSQHMRLRLEGTRFRAYRCRPQDLFARRCTGAKRHARRLHLQSLSLREGID